MKETLWNKAFYGVDCMDAEIGLPSYPDNYFEICYTDPPWGVDVDKALKKGRMYIRGQKLKVKADKEYYSDVFNPEWNLLWFNELMRICKGVIIVIGNKRKFWWIKNTEPIGELIIHHQNGHSGCKIAKFNRKSTYLFYGEFKNKLLHNVIDYVIPWGFLSKEKMIHPSPKGTELALKLLSQLEPKTVIDPFCGSGSYPYACSILGIKWIAYEINPIYKQDFDKRFSQKLILNY